MAQVPLLASTITRQTEETAEDIKGIIVRINESLWYAIQVNKSTDVDKTTMLISECSVFQEDVHEICYVHFCCQSTPQLQNYSSL